MPVVESSGAPVATAVFFTGHDTVVYSIGRPTAGVCKTNPNGLLLWLVVRHACEQGTARSTSDGASLPGRASRSFKSSWGPQRRRSPIRRSGRTNSPPTSASAN